ncbi:hypothetical protein GGR51DRAFT_576214 [Nemania sp. FL0031]|nr:hypothetical protein GGR51DRAFT_576214 [Nemania sp. FL0031]
MAYRQNYNFPQGSLPAGASFRAPGGYYDEPGIRMQPQIHPSRIVPSDEALLKSLYIHLSKDRWHLRYRPSRNEPVEYPITPSLTGRGLWFQRKEAFFIAHREIDERYVYHVDSRSFTYWIEERFNAQSMLTQAPHGYYGAVQDRCFILHDYVFWLDPTTVHVPTPSSSEYQSDVANSYWPASGEPPASGSDYYLTTDGMYHETEESSMYCGPNFDQRINDWQGGVQE